MALSPAPCGCDLPHPVLSELEGRAGDLLLAADGSRVHGSARGRGLKAIVDRAPPGVVRQVVFEQRDASHWRVLVESGEGFDHALSGQLETLVRQLFGERCRVEVERAAFIPRESSGKFRYYKPLVG